MDMHPQSYLRLKYDQSEHVLKQWLLECIHFLLSIEFKVWIHICRINQDGMMIFHHQITIRLYGA